ncbi:MAG: hypothetical protein AAGH15_10100, partial [Myxococcota bacterium]
MPADPRRHETDVLKTPVLVLNKSYQPVRITTARHAFLLLFGGRAQALSRSYEPYDFDDWAELPTEGHGPSLRTSSGRLRVPRLVLLADYNRVPRTPLRLSRRNVFLRDELREKYLAFFESKGCSRQPSDVLVPTWDPSVLFTPA